MNETDVRELIVRPLLVRLGYQHGTDAPIRTEVPLKYDKAFLGRKNPSRDPPLRGRSDYICDAVPYGRWVVEVKAPSEPVTEEAVQQAHTYAAHPEIAAAYFMVTNGRRFALYRTSSLASPLLEWPYEETDQKLMSLFNLVSPAAIQRLANLSKADGGKPLGAGISSAVRIIGGFVQYDEHEGFHPKIVQSIAGLRLPVTGGRVARDDEGRIHARVEVASAAPMMTELNDAIGLGSIYDFYSATEYLSTDVNEPSIFQNFIETEIKKGTRLSVPGLGRVECPFKYHLAAFTEAVGFVDNNRFRGTMRLDYEMSFTGIDSMTRQMLRPYLGDLPQRGQMKGLGQFEIEILGI